jgi:hypothetical protein
MLVISVRFGSRFSFHGQVAKCEVRAIDKKLKIKRTFVGMTFKEAFDEFKKDDISYNYYLHS